MQSARKTVCTLLVASMTLLPIHAARADTIALERALASQGAAQDAYQDAHQAAHQDAHQAALAQLQAHGISADAARERVAAMTGEEAATLAAQLESLPAGGNAAIAFLAVILFIAYVFSESMNKK